MAGIYVTTNIGCMIKLLTNVERVLFTTLVEKNIFAANHLLRFLIYAAINRKNN